MIAPWILEHFPSHRIYVEPYGGAASVLLRKQRSWLEVYNDLNGEVVNFFQVLRDPDLAAALAHQVYLTPYARPEYDLSYEPTTDPVERARRYALRSYGGHLAGGKQGKTGFRAKMNHGSTTTPAPQWANYPKRIMPISERLRGVLIEQRPALEVIDHYDDPAALFYIDPPYATESRPTAPKVYSYELTTADHGDLAAVLHKCAAMVVVSGYRCDLYADLYDARGWRRVDRPVHGNKGGRVESLWLSPATVTALESEHVDLVQARLDV